LQQAIRQQYQEDSASLHSSYLLAFSHYTVTRCLITQWRVDDRQLLLDSYPHLLTPQLAKYPVDSELPTLQGMSYIGRI